MSVIETSQTNALSKREARRQAILVAAAKLFLEKGYGATSLSDVVACSGGSLSTLYDMFGNKAGLFKELVTGRCREITGALAEAEADGKDVRRALTEQAHRLFDLVLSPDAVAVIRLIIAEGQQFPELAELFYASGPDSGRARVAEYLSARARRGELAIEDPDRAARCFCSLVLGDFQMRAACGLAVRLDDQEKARHIAAAVDTFLKAHAPERPA
ncbi:MAG: TetR/AcrR family transcriptional regulator [Alphaproteobacteria bacterium]|nr:TetR/AcrR family transcriptional regulator [Alphaproteobacteria bacterium]